MKTILYIHNLKCSGCVATITKELHKVTGIEIIKIFPEDGAIEMAYTSQDQVGRTKKILNTLGYPTQGEENSFSKKAKSYVSCALGKVNG